MQIAQEQVMIAKDRYKVQQEPFYQQQIFSYCISLDPRADEYVGDIFGRQFTVIDHIERLPERLPQLFMALTK
jgi:nitric oxide reductase activation protein